MSELPGVGVFAGSGNAPLLVEKLRGAGFTVVAIWCQTLEAALEAGAKLDVPFATNKVIIYIQWGAKLYNTLMKS